jgi:hypothetical protein
MATSFSGGRSLSTRREPPTMCKQLVNFITCGCDSSPPFFVIYKVGRELTPYWWYACMSCKVIQLPNSLSHPCSSSEHTLSHIWNICIVVLVCIDQLLNTVVSNHFHFVKILFFSSARSRDFDGMLDTGLPVSMYTTKTPMAF